MIYFKWETRKIVWNLFQLIACFAVITPLLFVAELVTRDSAEILNWLSWNGPIVLTVCLHYPLLKALIQHSPYFLSRFTQYTNTQPSFSAMVGSADYGSAFPWDSIPFTLSLQFLPTVLPMCLEDQGKHSHDEWLTEKESERLWTYFSTTSPGRMTPEIPTASRTRDNSGRILWCDCLRRAWDSWWCHVVITDTVLGWAHTPVCNLPVTGTVRNWSSDSCSQNCYKAQCVGLEVSVTSTTSLIHLPSCGFFVFMEIMEKLEQLGYINYF